MTRLENVSTKLVKRLQQSDSTKQRAAGLAAATLVISTTGVNHPVVKGALSTLQAGKELSTRQKEDLNSLIAKLDEEYFTLQEAAEDGTASTDDYLKVFGQARAVAAVLFAGGDDPLEAATEGIYEATATSDDPANILSVAEAALQ